ncbi:hypothetical protein AHF37_00390 [Paragonimus kellicotti]|nr:hypothetical protein AHF37_00390 [Paragonimus kellicotti]
MLRNVWTRYRVISFRHARKYSSVESEEIATPFFGEDDEMSQIPLVPPTGSALFRESEHFTPLVKPDPKFYWDAIQRSLNARGLSDQFNLEHLRDLKRQIEEIREQIGLVEAKRKEHQKIYETTKQDSEEARLQARRLRAEYQQLKRRARELLPQFLRPALAIPNLLHTECPVTDKSQLVLQFIRHPVGNTIDWSTIQDDLHIT